MPSLADMLSGLQSRLDTIEPNERTPSRAVLPGADPSLVKHVAGGGSLDVSDPRLIAVDGRTWLTSISHLRLARSADGVRFTIDPAPAMPVHVKITVNGTKIEAEVGGTKLSATGPAKGDVGLVARRGGHVEIANLSVKKP